MKRLNLFLLGLFIGIIVFSNEGKAQADTIMRVCTQFLPAPYVSDGQQYRAMLSEDETAEFKVTFYGQSTYRIVCCSGLSEGNLIFTVYDSERNKLFSSRDHKNTPFWDFKFKSTVNCIIEAELDNRFSKSGWAILLIGFKQ
jgi:hypothetical protein